VAGDQAVQVLEDTLEQAATIASPAPLGFIHLEKPPHNTARGDAPFD